MAVQSQTILDETNAVLPDLMPSVINSELNTIVLTPLEVESALKTLTVGKASGPNGFNNHILKELSSQLFFPFCSLFNQSMEAGILPVSMYVRSPRKETCLLSPITDLYLC